MRAAPLLTCNSHPALITLACAAQVVSYPSDAPPMAAAVGWAGDLVACCATEAWLALALATLALTAARTVFRARIFLASYTTVAGSAHAPTIDALTVTERRMAATPTPFRPVTRAGLYGALEVGVALVAQARSRRENRTVARTWLLERCDQITGNR